MLMLLASGIFLGATSGMTPGALLTFVISQTLNFGFKEGAKAAMAPLITDLPIIGLAFVIVWRFENYTWVPGLLAFAGAGFILFLAWDNLRFNPRTLSSAEAKTHSVLKGTLVNFLNPAPYFFWMTVGIPFLSRIWEATPGNAVVWVIGFYVALIGSKLTIAALVSHTRSFMSSRVYVWINRGLGLILGLFAIWLVKIGLGFIMAGQ